jgi:hypothetical protein
VVGDLVHFQFGAHTIEGMVVEDRGDIGVDGRQLVRVETTFNMGVQSWELPAAFLTLQTEEK